MLQERLIRLQKELRDRGLDCLALIPGANLRYMTGLDFHLMERPLMGFFPADGQPVFAIPELAEVPEACGVKVPPFDPRAFGAALRALAGDPARRAALGQAGKAYAAAFDWDVLAGRYADFFESVARPGLGSPPRVP